MLGRGLTVLDRELRLGEHLWVDAIGVGDGGRPVVVLVGEGDLPAELGRVAAAFSALRSGCWLLDRLYGDRGLDAFVQPSFVLLARRFSGPVEPLLALVSGLDLRLFEYAHASDGEGPERLVVSPLGVDGLPGPGGRPVASGGRDVARTPGTNGGHGGASAPVEPEREWLDRLGVSAECGRLCLRARDSIRSLSSGIAMTCDDGALTFRIEGEILAALLPERDLLRVRLGDGQDRPDLEVRDEAGIHAGLNAVFGDFFRRFATAE